MKLPRRTGVGPPGLFLSAVLLAGAVWVKPYIPLPQLFANPTIPKSALGAGIVLSIIVVIWSMRSLPVQKRGLGVCSDGPYRYVRHPVYAAFSTVGALGLALYLNHPIFLLWYLVIQLLWHWLVQFEEQMMIEEFGEEYLRYTERTGRLFPRMRRRSSRR